jgi:hypothetical protein
MAGVDQAVSWGAAGLVTAAGDITGIASTGDGAANTQHP